MSKFLNSLGVAQSELQLLSSIPAEAVIQALADTGEFQQGLWRLPSGEAVNFEVVSWEVEPPGPPGLWVTPRDDAVEDDEAKPEAECPPQPLPLLDRLPVDCQARVAAHLSLRDLEAACRASGGFADLARGDACWLERLRRHFGSAGRLLVRGGFRHAAADPCCSNPFARIFLHALFGLYRARPEAEEDAGQAQLQHQHLHQRLVPEASLGGVLLNSPLLSPVFLGWPLTMRFRFQRVHSGRYDVLLRVKKLLCDPLDSEAVASAADTSGVRVPLLQARINRRNVTISNFECTIEVTADTPVQQQQQEDPQDSTAPSSSSSSSASASPASPVLMKAETVSHLLQHYSMPADRWFYWRLATLELPLPENSPPSVACPDVTARVSVMRRGVVDATVTQEEFERELRNALLVDHLFLRLQRCQLDEPPTTPLSC